MLKILLALLFVSTGSSLFSMDQNDKTGQKNEEDKQYASMVPVQDDELSRKGYFLRDLRDHFELFYENPNPEMEWKIINKMRALEEEKNLNQDYFDPIFSKFFTKDFLLKKNNSFKSLFDSIMDQKQFPIKKNTLENIFSIFLKNPDICEMYENTIYKSSAHRGSELSPEFFNDIFMGENKRLSSELFLNNADLFKNELIHKKFKTFIDRENLFSEELDSFQPCQIMRLRPDAISLESKMQYARRYALFYTANDDTRHILFDLVDQFGNDMSDQDLIDIFLRRANNSENLANQNRAHESAIAHYVMERYNDRLGNSQAVQRARQQVANFQIIPNNQEQTHVNHVYKNSIHKVYTKEIEKYQDQLNELKDPVESLKQDLEDIQHSSDPMVPFSDNGNQKGRLNLYKYMISTRFEGKTGQVVNGKFHGEKPFNGYDDFRQDYIEELKLALCILRDGQRFGASNDFQKSAYFDRLKIYLDATFSDGARSWAKEGALLTDEDLLNYLIENDYNKTPGYYQMCAPGFKSILLDQIKNVEDTLRLKNKKEGKDIFSPEERMHQACTYVQQRSIMIRNSLEFNALDKPWNEKQHELNFEAFKDFVDEALPKNMQEQIVKNIDANIDALRDLYTDVFNESRNLPMFYQEENISGRYAILESQGFTHEEAVLRIKKEVREQLESEIKKQDEMETAEEQHSQENVNQKRRLFVDAKVSEVLESIQNNKKK